MAGRQKDRVLTSLLWGAVAAAGEHTMLFLAIVRRIHVRFANDAPVFYVDPGGPIALTKDVALASVWVMTLVYGVLVTLAVYFRPQPRRRALIAIGALAVVLSVIGALAEPRWGLVVLADMVALYPVFAGSLRVRHMP